MATSPVVRKAKSIAPTSGRNLSSRRSRAATSCAGFESAATCCWPAGILTRDLVHHRLGRIGCGGRARRSICRRRPVIINVVEQSLRRIALSVIVRPAPRESSARWTSRGALSLPSSTTAPSRLPPASPLLFLLCRIYFVSA